MSKPKTAATTEATRKPGRPKSPEGRKRSYWIGCACTREERLSTQATAARELPGKSFSRWLRATLGLPEE